MWKVGTFCPRSEGQKSSIVLVTFKNLVLFQQHSTEKVMRIKKWSLEGKCSRSFNKFFKERYRD